MQLRVVPNSPVAIGPAPRRVIGPHRSRPEQAPIAPEFLGGDSHIGHDANVAGGSVPSGTPGKHRETPYRSAPYAFAQGGRQDRWVGNLSNPGKPLEKHVPMR
jgi:hypothetical protein